METIFRVGDKVFDIFYGWGSITGISKDKDIEYPITVSFDEKGTRTYTPDGKFWAGSPGSTLSFTEYDFIDGGFSQKRPLPKLEIDDIVWVNTVSGWLPRCFKTFDNKGNVGVIPNGDTSKSTGTTHIDFYPEWSVEKPENLGKI